MILKRKRHNVSHTWNCIEMSIKNKTFVKSHTFYVLIEELYIYYILIEIFNNKNVRNHT